MNEVLQVERTGTVARVTLTRPEVRNTFNVELIESLRTTFDQLRNETPEQLRAVVLSGEGKAFCAGADIEWQLSARDLEMEENEADVRRLQEMLATIDNCPVPVVAAVHGAALGGGMALCCVADITLATADAIFGFTEVKLGLIPAAISPFVLPRVGEGPARALFLTGERFGSERALRIGVVSEVLPDQAALDARVTAILKEIGTAAPEAARNAKVMIRGQRNMSRGDALDRTKIWAARQRVSPEGQEGLGAFLEKRPPSWRE
jgi:methylglutaconyl-CoA hydratase